ncbi:MAG: hypothetical protein ACQEQI_09275 [Bacillota bacterium]
MGKIKEKLNNILNYYWHLGSKFRVNFYDKSLMPNYEVIRNKYSINI